jgi:hypothetical protein
LEPNQIGFTIFGHLHNSILNLQVLLLKLNQKMFLKRKEPMATDLAQQLDARRGRSQPRAQQRPKAEEPAHARPFLQKRA